MGMPFAWSTIAQWMNPKKNIFFPAEKINKPAEKNVQIFQHCLRTVSRRNKISGVFFPLLTCLRIHHP
jgi:hypothetical protein